MTPLESEQWRTGVLPRVRAAVADACDPAVALIASGLPWRTLHEIVWAPMVSQSTVLATEAAIELIESATLHS